MTRPADLKLIEGAGAAIRALNDAGVPAVLVSNQSGVARGLMSEDDLAVIHGALEKLLAEEGARLDAAYYCPNHLEGTDPRYNKDASCRKPSLGMLETAVRDLAIDVAGSMMVGDQVTDLEFAERAGMPGVLVATGKGARELAVARSRGISVAAFVPDVGRAVEWFMAGRNGWGLEEKT